MWRTEEEAKKAHCPLLIAGFYANSDETDCDIYCRASKCMMWRQNLITEDEVTAMKGYCGLAGVPPR